MLVVLRNRHFLVRHIPVRHVTFHRCESLYLDRSNDCLYFGDEIEYTLIRFDDDKKKVQLCLKAQKYLEKLRSKSDDQVGITTDCILKYYWTGCVTYCILEVTGKPFWQCQETSLENC